MTRAQLINGIINHAFETDADAKRQGNIIYLNIGEVESGNFIHLDAYIDDRCYQQGATALQPAEDGYAVDAVDIRWSAYNDKVFHLTDEQKKGLEEWVAEWLAEDWADAGEIARQAEQIPAWRYRLGKIINS